MPNWARQRKPWDIAPGDWRYFVRGGIVILLLVAAVTTIVRLVLRLPLDHLVLTVAVLVTGVMVGTQWFGTVHVTRAINRMTRELPVPPRPVSATTVVVGTLAVWVLLTVGIAGIVGPGDGPDARGWPLAALIAVGPALLGTGVVALLGRRTLAVLRQPSVQRIIMMDAALATGQPVDAEPVGRDA